MAFRWARSNVVFKGELSDGDNQDKESARDERNREILTLPLKRLADEAELFARLSSHRYRFQALFGEKSTVPFDKIASVYNDLQTSIAILSTVESWGSIPRDDRSHEQIVNLRDKIWGHGPNDQIAKDVDLAVSEIEALCRPALSTKLF